MQRDTETEQPRFRTTHDTYILRYTAMPGPLTPRHKCTRCTATTMRPCKPRDSARSALHANCTARIADDRALPCTPEGHYTALRPLTGAAKYTRGAHEYVETKIESGPRLRVAHDPQSPMRSSDGHTDSAHMQWACRDAPSISTCGVSGCPSCLALVLWRSRRPADRTPSPSPVAAVARVASTATRLYTTRSVCLCLSVSVCLSVCLSVCVPYVT
jgi:hypothetical protein